MMKIQEYAVYTIFSRMRYPLPDYLMIWGGWRKNQKWIYFFRGNALWKLFFPGEGLLRFFFSWKRPFEFFCREAFWNLFFPGSGFEIFFSFKIFFPYISQSKYCLKSFFFSHEHFLDLFFSWGGPFEIFFWVTPPPKYGHLVGRWGNTNIDHVPGHSGSA